MSASVVRGQEFGGAGRDLVHEHIRIGGAVVAHERQIAFVARDGAEDET